MAVSCGMWDLSSPTRDWNHTPCIGRQNVNLWTTKEVPCILFHKEIPQLQVTASVLLPGKFHGWRNLIGCSPWGREELDMTEQLHFTSHMKVTRYCKSTMCENRSVISDSLWPHGWYSPWNSLDQNTGVGRLSLLQGIFLMQRSNPGLPHHRQILYQLSHKESPYFN